MWVANANDNTVTKLQGSDGTALAHSTPVRVPAAWLSTVKTFWVANSGVNYVLSCERAMAL